MFDARYNYCENGEIIYYQIEVMRKTNIDFDRLNYELLIYDENNIVQDIKPVAIGMDGIYHGIYTISRISYLNYPLYEGAASNLNHVGLKIVYNDKIEELSLTFNEDKMKVVF